MVYLTSEMFNTIKDVDAWLEQLREDLAFLIKMIPFAFDGGIVGTPEDHEIYDTIKSRYEL